MHYTGVAMVLLEMCVELLSQKKTAIIDVMERLDLISWARDHFYTALICNYIGSYIICIHCREN